MPLKRLNFPVTAAPIARRGAGCDPV